MNRSDRRRQEARQGTGHYSGLVTSRLEEGKVHLQAGRLAEAERAYRLALDIAPQHPEALHLLGLVSYRQNRLTDALVYLNAAVEQQPSSPLYWFNLGVISQKANRPQEAMAAYQKAVALNSRYLEAHINLGNVLRDRGDLAESIKAYRAALALNPSQADTHNNLGVALKELGQIDEAIASYRRALELKPTHVEALNNLGLALMEGGTLHDAIASFQQALTIVPGYQKALYNLGIAWSWAGEDTKAVDCLQQVARAKHDHGKAVAETVLYRSRVKHDVEQIQYLLDQHSLDDGQRPYLASLQQLLHELDQVPLPGNRLSVAPEIPARIASSFNRLLYCMPPVRLEQGTLNPALDVNAIEARYLGRHPEVTYIDGLLNWEALDALRRFCWEATIWKKDYENGYSGAFLGDGFASPLLFQIAEELRRRFPRIFSHHRLTQAWAFKHDSARRGLNIHADAAAVNVNFWITADDANLNPDTGGLVVYDKEAPKEWNFKDYNSAQNKSKILSWLKEAGAEAVKIPYRANRAVVFNSDLFHETDEISFKDDYLSRRINITLLYGYRLKA
ncbi:MAG TPA: tetratricopeptide repeat protein [Nitrospira sp.]|nr:tetratricopeptide repeat protein [Nitrospira sp.]